MDPFNSDVSFAKPEKSEMKLWCFNYEIKQPNRIGPDSSSPAARGRPAQVYLCPHGLRPGCPQHTQHFHAFAQNRVKSSSTSDSISQSFTTSPELQSSFFLKTPGLSRRGPLQKGASPEWGRLLERPPSNIWRKNLNSSCSPLPLPEHCSAAVFKNLLLQISENLPMTPCFLFWCYRLTLKDSQEHRDYFITWLVMPCHYSSDFKMPVNTFSINTISYVWNTFRSLPFSLPQGVTTAILGGHCPPRPYNLTVCPATTTTHIRPSPHLHCRQSSPAFCPHHHLQSLDAKKFSQPTKNSIHSSTLTPAKSFQYHDSLTYLTWPSQVLTLANCQFPFLLSMYYC